ncbi:hypothetical protein HAX54_050034 [Datura stramonium]|uniref:Uncharacterized protein n=1 Tax=Datura stramonium TaxID=4076 RepID=A0ABS8SWK2_DATST|nr:hypothetical protein [Datura stramonium]
MPPTMVHRQPNDRHSHSRSHDATRPSVPPSIPAPSGELKFWLGGEEVVFKVCRSSKKPRDMRVISIINTVEEECYLSEIRFIGTPNVDPQPMRNLLLRPPYIEIFHSHSAPRPMARWSGHQRFGPVNVGVIVKDVLRRERVKKGQRFSFGGFLTRFPRAQQIEEEDVDYGQ